MQVKTAYKQNQSCPLCGDHIQDGLENCAVDILRAKEEKQNQWWYQGVLAHMCMPSCMCEGPDNT